MICQQTFAIMKGQIQSHIMKVKRNSYAEKYPIKRDLSQSKFASLCRSFVSQIMSFHDE